MSDFRKIRRLDGGNFGEVWLCHDDVLDVDRAVKYIDVPAGADKQAFRDEARAMQGVAHENVVRVYEAGIMPSGDEAYIAMEYLENGSIERERASGGFLPARRAKAVTSEALRGLQHMHDHGFVHGDIKPANLLVGSDGRAKLGDFGLSRKLSAAGARLRAIYEPNAAPELLQGSSATVATDVYAMGVTFYRLLNGEGLSPRPRDLEAAIIAGEYPRRNAHQPFVPLDVQRVITTALEVDPANRFRSANEFRRALDGTSLMADWDLDLSGTWRGQSGQRHHEVQLTVHSGGPAFGVEVRSGLGRSSLRRVSGDCIDGVSSAKATTQQRRVMRRISRTGR